jgi:hypothetical protein
MWGPRREGAPLKVAASGVWDPVQRVAHHLVESGVQQPQIIAIEAKPWHTSQGEWGAAKKIMGG